jgi:uncharacterized protein
MTAPAPTPFRDRYGPWALVTGASSGIGAALARDLAARGLDLLITARRAPLLDGLAAELRRDHGIEVEVLAVDLATPGGLAPLIAACASRDVGLVACNAGVGLKGLHHSLDPAALAAMLQVNCAAPMLLAHALAPHLIERHRGALLFTGSIEAFLGFPWSSAYAATKAFVHVLGEGLWGELDRQGVDVLVLSPGATDTDAPTLQGIDKAKIPGRMMPPAEVAAGTLDRLARAGARRDARNGKRGGGRHPIYVPGLANRALVRLLTLLPRRLALRLTGKGIRDTLAAP